MKKKLSITNPVLIQTKIVQLQVIYLITFHFNKFN